MTVVRPERLELPTYCLEGSCSIQLSYGHQSYPVRPGLGIAILHDSQMI